VEDALKFKDALPKNPLSFPDLISLRRAGRRNDGPNVANFVAHRSCRRGGRCFRLFRIGTIVIFAGHRVPQVA